MCLLLGWMSFFVGLFFVVTNVGMVWAWGLCFGIAILLWVIALIEAIRW
jgi:hypothetical protein